MNMGGPASVQKNRLLWLFCFFGGTYALLPAGLYCGEQNCYEVLGINRDTERSEMGKVYRKLASKWHPDRWKTTEEKKRAEEQFRLIATAYETLKEEDSRRDYDYMLDHPDEFYYNYYQYYRRRVAPKVDVRIVIAGTILVISLVQYISATHKYDEAIKYLMTQPKYRLQAQQIARERGLIYAEGKKPKRKQDKIESREREEQIIRDIIEENADIKGGYSKPRIVDLLAIQIFCWPWYLIQHIVWYVRWVWRFSIRGESYGEEEKVYLIRRNLKISQAQYDSLEEKQQDEFWARELWISEKFAEWKREREEIEKQKMAESGKYKQYRRYMRNQGPGQISFGPE